MVIMSHAIKHNHNGDVEMFSFIFYMVTVLTVALLSTLKVEMSDGSFYRPVAETLLCCVVIVVCYLV